MEILRIIHIFSFVWNRYQSLYFPGTGCLSKLKEYISQRKGVATKYRCMIDILLKGFPAVTCVRLKSKGLCNRLMNETGNHPGVHRADSMDVVKRHYVRQLCWFNEVIFKISTIPAVTTIRTIYMQEKLNSTELESSTTIKLLSYLCKCLR